MPRGQITTTYELANMGITNDPNSPMGNQPGQMTNVEKSYFSKNARGLRMYGAPQSAQDTIFNRKFNYRGPNQLVFGRSQGVGGVNQTQFGYRKGGGLIKGGVIIEDYASPGIEYAQKTFPPAVRAAVMAACQRCKAEIIKSYEKATFESVPNTPATLANKYGYRTLVDSGSLEMQLRNMDVKFYMASEKFVGEVRFTPPEAGNQVYEPGYQERQNKDYVYMWSHEFGTRRRSYKFGIKHWKYRFILPKRPFLKRGVNQGVNNGYRIINVAWSKWFARTLKRNKNPSYGFVGFNLEREYRTSVYDVGMFVIPPTSLWATIGGGRDALGYIGGSFSAPKVESWLVAWGKGSGGATKRVQRRKFRRSIWYR